MKKEVNKLDHVTAAITRWQSRLRRAANMLAKLEKQRKRLAAKAAKPKPHPVEVLPVPTLLRELSKLEPKPESPKTEIDTSIPAFLQRKKPDPVAEQIAQEQAETKKRKALGRIATMKAKKSGETRKMPLTGRAALAAIRNTQ
jgi:hypothetical protein